MNARIPSLTALFLGLLVTAATTVRAADTTARPAPELGPDEVVSIQMQALMSNDVPFDNAGIEVTFRFASPNNKRVTGPLEKFATLFDNPAYGPMLNHRSLQIGEVDIIGERARVPVFVEADDGARLGYVFLLSRQAGGEWADCWMTDSVTLLQALRPEKVTL